MASRFVAIVFAALALAVPIAASAAAKSKSPAPDRGMMIERGRYLAWVGGCNDCHTAHFAERAGQVPEKDWFLGDPALGWTGPWGTTYSPNLRYVMSKMTEAQWVKHAKTFKTRPPMPWFNVHRWKDGNLRAFYQFVKRLGPPGEAVTKYLQPGTTPPQPFVHFSLPVPGK